MAETITRFGETIELDGLPVTSPYETSFWAAWARGHNRSWESTKARWGVMTADERVMSHATFVERYGEDVAEAYNQGVTESNAEAIALEHRRQLAGREYESRGFVEFMGGLLPSLPDPVNVATMPFGAGNAVRAVKAAARGAMGDALKQSVVGGFKAGAASVPVEAVVQQQAQGEMSAGGLLASFVAPIVFSPLIAAPGFVVSKLRNGRLVRAVAEQGNVQVGDDVQAIADAVADLPDMPGPLPRPDTRSTGPTRLPNEQFSEVGGVKAWAVAAARGEPEALAFAARNNINMDSPALRAFFVAEENRQVATTPQDPQASAEAAIALTAFARGERGPEVLEGLRKHGMLQERAGAPPELAPAFRALVGGLATDDPRVVQDFLADGPARTKTLAQQKTWDEIKAVSEDAAMPAAEKRLRLDTLYREQAEQAAGPRSLNPDQPMDEEVLLDVLSAARLEAPRTAAEMNGRSGDGANVPARHETPGEEGVRLPEEQDARDFTASKGAEVDDVDHLIDEAMAAVQRCLL